MANIKTSKSIEIEILTLYYNGFTNMQKISDIVKVSIPTISRIIGQSFEDGVNLKKGVLIVESKMNYDQPTKN